ncbi:MAG: NAD(P)-dependent oxidoreductase [Rhodocyclales bacterium]|nr:NAD(P)-dependent oxidoreductase [Rhodocyclales bacterium]
MGVAVIGVGSFIAAALRARPETAAWRFVSHTEALAGDAWLAGLDVVINCAFDARLKREPYDPAHDVDLVLAAMLGQRAAVRYVMLSSRMAYGPAGPDGRLDENREPRPVHPYGIAKLETERRLAALLGERLTVLRLSNVFGYELMAGRANFFAMALRGLHEQGRIVFDMSPFVERDFLPVESLAEQLPRVVGRLRAGLYNLGAGTAIPTGRIAQWLIEGYGEGELLVTRMREHDGFWLDISAAQAAFGIAGVDPAQVRANCVALGQRLRAEAEVGR